jgi:hypothetical protein
MVCSKKQVDDALPLAPLLFRNRYVEVVPTMNPKRARLSGCLQLIGKLLYTSALARFMQNQSRECSKATKLMDMHAPCNKRILHRSLPVQETKVDTSKLLTEVWMY